MGLENDIPDTPTVRQTTITLAMLLATYNYSCFCRCCKHNLLLNAKVSTDHVGGNLLVLAVRGEIDLEIRSIAELQLGIPLLILFHNL